MLRFHFAGGGIHIQCKAFKTTVQKSLAKRPGLNAGTGQCAMKTIEQAALNGKLMRVSAQCEAMVVQQGLHNRNQAQQSECQ